MVIPARVRDEIVRHARDEQPNESCGLLVLRDGVADRYERGVNAAASPYRFELHMDDPEVWFLEAGSVHGGGRCRCQTTER